MRKYYQDNGERKKLSSRPTFIPYKHAMTNKVVVSKRKRTYEQERDFKTKLFFLFFLAQICAIIGMVVGVLFFILRIFKLIS